MAWWYEKGGEARGPVSSDELQSFILKKQLPANTLIWCSGMGEWCTYTDLISDFGPDIISWCAENMTDYNDNSLTPPTIPGQENKYTTATSSRKIIYYDNNATSINQNNTSTHKQNRHSEKNENAITIALMKVLVFFLIAIVLAVLLVKYNILPGIFVASVIVAAIALAAISDVTDRVSSFLSKDSDDRFDIVYSKKNIAIYLLVCAVVVIAKKSSVGFIACIILTGGLSIISFLCGFIVCMTLVLTLELIGAESMASKFKDHIDWFVPLSGIATASFMLFR